MKRSLLATTSSSAVLSGIWLIASSPLTAVHGFLSHPIASLPHHHHQSTQSVAPLFIQAPPGSGYFAPEDEVSALPDTYEPMMEYPGTMRPGRTPENIPFQDLPIADTDPDPVPWPHFQQIEWHHRWGAPHDHATPMEQFIEQNGRWASPELEASMRAGIRRGVRERREAEEAERRGTIITDDDEDDDDDEMDVNDDPVSLGDGVFGQLGSDADRAQTAAAVDPKNNQKESYFEEEETEDEAEGALDDFLFDLGLDSELGDDDFGDDASEESNDDGKPQAKSLRELETDDDEEDDVADEGVKAIQVDDDDDLDFDDDDEEASGDGSSVNLDDFDGGDEGVLDGEDIFDEGGFDFGDDYGDSDGGDVW